MCRASAKAVKVGEESFISYYLQQDAEVEAFLAQRRLQGIAVQRQN
jgi:hypothetical protein